MTRDQAIEIFGSEKAHGYMHGSICARWIDSFIALGMLKLEEPKNGGLAIKAINRAMSEAYPSTFSVLQEIDRAGLKIVEK